MTSKTIDERWAEVHQLTTNVNVANEASLAYNNLIRHLRIVIEIENELSKPNQESQSMLGDAIDICQKRRNTFDEWLKKNEPILHEKVSALTNGD